MRAAILTDKEKMILTPTCHVFDPYKPFMGATHIPLSLDSPKYVAGEISLLGFKANTATDRTLTADAIDAHNTFDKPNAVAPKPYRRSQRRGRWC